MTVASPHVERCRCGHARYIHTPTGRMDDTDERGRGRCTAGVFGHPCICTDYTEAQR